MVFQLHCITMALLYVCQGLISGALAALPVLLVEAVPSFSSTQAAILALPLYVFSFKFLWAPLVDRCYSKYLANEMPTHAKPGGSHAAPSPPHSKRQWSLHRRVQFVVPLQCIMAGLFGVLAVVSGPWCDYDDGMFLRWMAGSPAGKASAAVAVVPGEWLVTAIFSVLALCSATQDISVDAWAVEGMHTPDQSSLAGTLQMVGLVVGSTACQLYVVYRAWMPLSVFFGGCGVFCFACGCLACALGLVHTPSLLVQTSSDTEGAGVPSENAPSVVAYAKEIFHAPRPRAFVFILLTRGWPFALMPVLTLRLQSHKVIDAALLAQLRICTTLLSILTGSFVSHHIIRRLSSHGALRWNSRCDLILCAVSAALYLSVTSDLPPSSSSLHFAPNNASTDPSIGGSAAAAALGFSLITRDMYVGIVVVLSIVAAVVGATSFVAVVVQASTEAASFPRDAATTITLFNAMANLGYTLPSSAVMFLVDPLCAWVNRVFLAGEGGFFLHRGPIAAASLSDDNNKGSVRYVSADRLGVSIIAVVLITWSLLIRRWWLVPSVHCLERRIDGTTDSSTVLLAEEKDSDKKER